MRAASLPQGCPTGTVTVPSSVAATNWTSSPCGAVTTAFYQAAAGSGIVLGGLPALSPPPTLPASPPASVMSTRNIVNWLAVITAIYGFFIVVGGAALLVKALGAVKPAGSAYVEASPAAVLPDSV